MSHPALGDENQPFFQDFGLVFRLEARILGKLSNNLFRTFRKVTSLTLDDCEVSEKVPETCLNKNSTWNALLTSSKRSIMEISSKKA